MHAYITACIVGKKHHQENYKRIVQLLTEKGVDVESDHILHVTEKDIQLQTKQQLLTFHKRLENAISIYDFLVAETSFPNISVGYEKSKALDRGKPVIALNSQSVCSGCSHTPGYLTGRICYRMVISHLA